MLVTKPLDKRMQRLDYAASLLVKNQANMSAELNVIAKTPCFDAFQSAHNDEKLELAFEVCNKLKRQAKELRTRVEVSLKKFNLNKT